MIITLCGSTKFADEFDRWEWELTMAGHSVFSLVGKDDRKRQDLMSFLKDTVDMVHMRKIAVSGAVVVVDREPEMANGERYSGESTAKFLAFAYTLEKRVYLTSSFVDPVHLIEKIGGGQ